MDQTVPFGFPYPQCDPPLTKDAADIAQLRDLAIAVDAVVEDLAVEADDLLISPDAAVMGNSGTQNTTVPEEGIVFNFLEYDTSASGDLGQLAQSQFVAQQTGQYLITFSLRFTYAVSTIHGAVTIDIAGLGTGPYGQSHIGTGQEGGFAIQTTSFLNIGDSVRFRWGGTLVNGGIAINSARAGIWRIL